MASSQVEVEKSEIGLKHLGFVRILTINAVILVSNVYDHAKQNSGSLKSTVDKVENAVTTVVGPVYHILEDVPTHLLIFLDKKVDQVAYKFNECAPPTVKKVAFKANLVVKKASQTVQELAEEAKVGGPLAAVSRAGSISRHFAVSQLAFVWYKVNQHPSLHGISGVAISTATYWSEKFNNLVKGSRAKGYSISYYVPLLPVEEMGEAYKKVEASAAGKKQEASSSSESESDKE
ncbi:hypothetical protein ACS0TY_010903 [Phlomoides rotata]